jgi:hypothetical protein
LAVWAKTEVEDEYITAPATGVGMVKEASGRVIVLVEVVGPDTAWNPLAVPPFAAERMSAVVMLNILTEPKVGAVALPMSTWEVVPAAVVE